MTCKISAGIYAAKWKVLEHGKRMEWAWDEELQRENGTEKVAGGSGIHLTWWENLSDVKVAVREVGVVHLAHHLELASTSEAVCRGGRQPCTQDMHSGE
jgi:hypothetical protein